MTDILTNVSVFLHGATGTRLLSFNRTHTKVVIGLLTGHSTLRRHLCIMGLGNDPMCRCGTEEETLVHVYKYMTHVCAHECICMCVSIYVI